MKYLNDGAAWHPTPDADLPIHDRLPVGCYSVVHDKKNDVYFLQEVEGFSLPSKLYGRVEQYAQRILTTFAESTSQTGVLLSGLKGSGKTLLSKVLGAQSGVPVIIVNEKYHDDKFLRLIQGITQRAVIIFDEFEKVYNDVEQQAVLTLFDGVYTAQNKLIILTVNNRFAVNAHFHNRPGRLRYAIEFQGLEPEFIREYCQDHLRVTQPTADDIVAFSAMCTEFNFDMLQTLVGELNRFGGTLEEAAHILNVKPVSVARETWTVTVEAPQEPGLMMTVKDPLARSPMALLQNAHSSYASVDVDVSFSGKLRDGTEFDQDTIEISFNVKGLVKVDAYKNLYAFTSHVYVDEDGDLCDYRGDKRIALTVTVQKLQDGNVHELPYERFAC